MKEINGYFLALLVLVLLAAWKSVTTYLEEGRRDMEFAYAMGSSVQFTGDGALVICNGKADYIAIPHKPGAGEFVRRYVEAVCR